NRNRARAVGTLAPRRRGDGGNSGGASIAPPDVQLVDLFRPSARPDARRGRLRAAVGGSVAVAVAERERRHHLELLLEARAPLLPALLVLELVLVQRRRLLDAVRVAELDREVRRLPADRIPRRAERELVRDGADAARVDVARKRDRADDRARPERRLR